MSAGRDGSAWAINAADGKVIWQVVGTPGKRRLCRRRRSHRRRPRGDLPLPRGDLMAVLKIGGGTKVWQKSLAGKRLGRAYA
jgi:outer membrane protein assembly factor BamB